jgi:hypothetical protein
MSEIKKKKKIEKNNDEMKKKKIEKNNDEP